MLYTKKLEEFVDSFCTKHQLLNHTKKTLLSISGGVDSMVLFHFFLNRHADFEVIHFNHGTRVACLDEETFVINLCKSHSIKYHIIHLKLDLESANFEAIARQMRQLHYQKFLQLGYVIACAHHLDDAFEWHLMQKFKQSSLKKLLGIPVKNNGIIRPFLCLAKKHIYHYARLNQLVWFEDESNLNIKYERNYLRIKIIEEIKKRYPSYLQQFVQQQNNLLALYQSRENSLKIVTHHFGGVVVKAQDLSLHHDRILEVIESLSLATRGKLSKTLTQLFQSYLKAKADSKRHLFYGPYKFSGGVMALVYENSIYFYTQREIDYWHQVDLDYSRDHKSAQITYGLLNQKGLKFFPNIHLSKTSKSKLIFPLLPLTLSKEKQSDILFSYLV